LVMATGFTSMNQDEVKLNKISSSAKSVVDSQSPSSSVIVTVNVNVGSTGSLQSTSQVTTTGAEKTTDIQGCYTIDTALDYY